ncbi:MAG: hypothetical protein QM706_09850 [Nitrospira sp.]
MAHCLTYGQQIIDGKIPGVWIEGRCSMSDGVVLPLMVESMVFSVGALTLFSG